MCLHPIYPTETGANMPRKRVGRVLLLWPCVRRGVVDDLPFPGFRILRQVEVLLRAAFNCSSDGQIAANKQDKAFTSEAAALSCSGMTVSRLNARILRCEKKEHPWRGAPSVTFCQHSLAPAGTLSSISIRCSFSSPFSLCTAEISMPQEGMPIIFRGGRFRMAMAVLPISCSGS